MNDNYLWDRSGEPDADVQELEELLGALKYQPRPLQIPPTLRAGRKRSVIPLAIAAAIALVMTSAGLWIHFGGSHASPAVVASNEQRASTPKETAAPSPQDQIVNSTLPKRVATAGQVRKASPSRLARNNPRHIHETPAALTEQELAQRDQVLIALRLVSAKLNLAQRKTQTLPLANTIRN
jgi:hypothetical protein